MFTDPPNQAYSLEQRRIGSPRSIAVTLLLLPLAATIVLPAAAVPILQPGDPIVAVDVDPLGAPESSYPGTEGPANILDAIATTKYVNFGRANSGFIVTPAAGATTLQSFRLTTANDEVGRDPSAFALYGTNDPITSTDNSLGNGEAWALIAMGPLALPDPRLTLGPVVAVVNATAYTSYRMIFTALKSSMVNSMQIADAAFFQSTDGSGSNFLAAGDSILAIDLDLTPSSSHPFNEGADKAIDGLTNTKYLNFGEGNSGFIVTPAFGPSIVTEFVITTANDEPARDPATWALHGTNDPISSADNSQGMGETWTLIAQGPVSLPDARLTLGPTVLVSNSASYSSYRLIFPTVKNASTANSMHFSEIQFGGTAPPVTPTPTATPTLMITSTPTSTPSATPSATPTSGPSPTPTSVATVEIPAASGLGLLLLGLLLGAASLALLRQRS